MANYFRRFVQGYSGLVAPLTELTKDEVPFVWGQAQQRAFDGVKFALTNPPVLTLPDFLKGFEVITDASLFGTGAVLLQDGKPVAYASAKFSPAERNYTTGEQELLGVVRALQEWRCYLEGGEGEVTLVTDHNPLIYLSRRQARWMEFFSRFHYKWEYRPGRNNIADPVSRNPALVQEATVSVVTRSGAGQNSQQAPSKLDYLSRTILSAYKKDKWFSEEQNLEGLVKDDQGLWLKDNKVVVPGNTDAKAYILYELHDREGAGHGGIAKTTELVRRHYWWKGLREDIAKHVNSCELCQRNKASTKVAGGLLQPLPIPEQNWSSVSMDFITQLPRTQRGKDSIVVFVDRLSKMTHFAAIRTTATAEAVADVFFERVVSQHGLPRSLVTDRDSKFTGAFWTQLCTRMGVKQCMSTAYHPQTDGQTERMNRVLETALRHCVSPTQKDWDTKLAMIEFAVTIQ